MSDASAVVAAAEDAVIASDSGEQIAPSAEVQAAEKQAANNKASKASKAKAPAAKAAAPKPAAKAKPAVTKKYDDATRAASDRARVLRGKSNAVAPVTVTRVVAALSAAKMKPEDIVKSFASIKRATAYAGGDKTIETPALVKELSAKIDDPFARSRGLVSISLALSGK